MRILGIDYGEARCGVAITDPLGITAQGIKTIEHKGSDRVLLRELTCLLKEYPDVEEIVVGNPINLNGSESERSKKTDDFIHKLKCLYNKIRINKIDERFTTVEAHKTMNDLGINKQKKKKIVDTLSAVYILETYMAKSKND